jgi:thiosulfate dehydrogenase [quinone] large subunit
MTPAARAPERYLWPLRLFLGATFAYAGLQKLANPDYLDAHSPTSVQRTILSLQHSSPIGPLLGLSAHAPVLVGVLIALGELAVGLATLLGLWVRVAAAGGLLLALTFFLTVSFHTRPYYYGSDIVFVFAWTVPLLAGGWPDPTLDGRIARRAETALDPRRRALVLGGGGALALAGGVGALAALTAGIGRALHRSTATADGVTATPARPPSPAGSSAQPTTSATPTAAPPGRLISSAAGLPPGRALRFQDANGDPAWLVHEQDGGFRAFSAVCTHAGCTVDVSDGEFVCPCHGGRYDIRTGAVTGGPPPVSLPSLPIRVVDGGVRLV